MRRLFNRGILMKKVFGACALAAALTLAGSAYANEKLAQSSGCMTCHGVDKKVIGPSYKEVATKYRGDKGAEAALIKKVKAGGKGVWGEMPMPPNAHLKDEDIKTLVVWILAHK
jgi:cytochrome c